VSSGAGGHHYKRAISAKGILMFGCHVIRLDIELSQQREAFKSDFSILVSFDEL
jgi:hypothetical protein